MSGTQTVNQDSPGVEGPPVGARGDDRDLMLRLQSWFQIASERRHAWRIEAEADDAFVSGHQWSEEDLQALQDQNRPAVTFNRIGPFIDGVSGLEISNRQETRIIPRTMGSAAVSETMTGAVKWARDECDAEDEESEAFRDCVKAGEGWIETRLDYDEDPDGMILISRVDWREIYPDPASCKQNYSDARYVFRVRDVPIEMARQLAPDFDDTELDAQWARFEANNAQTPHDAREAPFYKNDQSGREALADNNVRMVQVEWWDYERAWRVLDPTTGRFSQVTEEEVTEVRAAFAARGTPWKAVADRKKRYFKALLGAVILQKVDGAERGGFGLKAITAKRDGMTGQWYGLVRAMRDPQMWANKWLSQVLHIINSNAKGGLLAEAGAFENPQQAQDDWADPQSIILTSPGAIRNGMIMPRPQAQFPAGIQQLAEFAIASIPGTTGISPEMMGTTQTPQAGVLEMQRKQQGMVLLSDLFNALRRYRKEQGRLLVWLITTFISDGRLIRIVGQDDAKYVPLLHEPGQMEYDVLVDDTPSSPNMKERTWGALVQLFPVLTRMQIPPSVMLELLAFSPLPDTLVSKLKVEMQQAQQQAQQAQQDNPQHAAMLASEQAKAQMHIAEAQRTRVETQLLPVDKALTQQRQQADIEAQRALAIANLAKVGLAHRGSQLAEAEFAVDTLLRAHQQMTQATQPSGAPVAPVGQPEPAPQQGYGAGPNPASGMAGP